MKLAIILALTSLACARDCYLSCDQVQITYDKGLCYKNCDQKIIMGVTIGVFIGLCFLLCFICYCRHRNHVSMYFLTRRLKQKLNIVDSGTITLEMFEKLKEEFISAISKSDLFNNFFFEINKKKCEMTIQSDSFTTVQEGNFLTQIKFKGKDSYSPFFVQGYFLCKKGKPYVWFTKRYEPYQLAVQYGLAEVILFQSVDFNRQAWRGTWNALEHQDKADVNGKWNLIMRVTGITNHLQQIGNQLNIN